MAHVPMYLFCFAGVQTKNNMLFVTMQCTLTNATCPETTPDVPCKIESEIEEEQEDDDYVV